MFVCGIQVVGKATNLSAVLQNPTKSLAFCSGRRFWRWPSAKWSPRSGQARRRMQLSLRHPRRLRRLRRLWRLWRLLKRWHLGEFGRPRGAYFAVLVWSLCYVYMLCPKGSRKLSDAYPREGAVILMLSRKQLRRCMIRLYIKKQAILYMNIYGIVEPNATPIFSFIGGVKLFLPIRISCQSAGR